MFHFPLVLISKLNKVRKTAKIRNRYNQAPHLTQDTNGKVTTSQLDITKESQEVSPFPAGYNFTKLASGHSFLTEAEMETIDSRMKKHKLIIHFPIHFKTKTKLHYSPDTLHPNVRLSTTFDLRKSETKPFPNLLMHFNQILVSTACIYFMSLLTEDLLFTVSCNL